jgi:hypothetical protein
MIYIIVLTLAVTTAALAQPSTTFRDASGRTTGTKLLERAGNVYSNSSAKEAGDGTLRTLVRRVAWLEDRAESGECRT